MRNGTLIQKFLLEIGVKSIIPPSAWQTQVSPLPEAGGHLSPLGPSATDSQEATLKKKQNRSHDLQGGWGWLAE